VPDDVRWTTPGGGPTLWLELPKRIDIQELEARLAKRGVTIEITSDAFIGERHLNGFRVSYAFLSPSKLREGLAILASAL
jgi:DNA-binding transcriptional MocR family regulator